MRSALVVADGGLPSRELWTDLVESVDLVVAADGGADAARAAGIKAQVLVGDLDSVSDRELRRFPSGRVFRDDDPDTNDLEKTMRFLARRKVGRVYILGASGGRLDHTLGSLAVVAAWGGRMDVRLIDDHFTTTLVTRRTVLRRAVGTIVSLIAPAGARGVTTKGLRYDLRDHDLPFSTLGIHNEVRRNPAEIRVREGSLFLLLGHRVHRHR